MDHVWIIYLITNTKDYSKSEVILYVNQEDIEREVNYFPSGATFDKYQELYPNATYVYENEYRDKYCKLNGVYCLEDFYTTPPANTCMIRMSDREFYDNKLDSFLEKNFRIHTKKVIVNNFN